MIRRQLINFQNRSVDVRVGLGAFEELSRMFASAVGKPKRALVVWNDATSERFGEVVEHALVDAGFVVSQLPLEVSPAGATLADADTIFGALSANGITCDDLVVAVGDAATCSVVCWCANQWCGRTECALLPTTFDAMLTVATTMKPLVASSSNALPAIAFRPESGLVVCDLDLVREADPEDLKLGYVVLVGTMLSSSKSRWNQFTETVPEILSGEEVALVNAVQWSQTARKDVLMDPSWRRPMLIFIRFSASLMPWAVRRTYSPPASTIRLACATLASVSCVAVFVILCMRIGLEPPIGVAPMFTSDVSRRE